MTRRIVLLACCLALMGADGCPPAPEVEATQPNVLLIIADDQSFDHYGFAGHPVLQTPSIDALAAQSLRYPTTYVSSVCRPTLATLLTGLPEHQHGVTYLAGPRLDDFATVAHRLGDVGYSTYQAGKFWEGNPWVRGFTKFAPFTSFVGNLQIGRTSIHPIFDFIAATESPWFVWFSPFMPHSPHDPPDEYRAAYEGLGLNARTVEYFGMISWFDAVVGELLLGIDDDTVVIFLADNGFVQSAFSEFQAPNSKNSSYEHGVRTQLLIRHPGTRPHSRWALVDASDVVTTILSIAGADTTDLPGRDLLASLVFDWSAFGSRSTLGIGDTPGVLLERWVRLGNWKLVDVEDGDDRMHHLDRDPEEVVNLIDLPRSRSMQSALRSELERLWSQ